MEMKSFILKYASKIMFYDVNIACYQIVYLSMGGDPSVNNPRCKRRSKWSCNDVEVKI